MNKRSHLHKKPDSSASNPVQSQFQSRLNIAQAKPQSQKPLTQTQTENGEFQQQKFEATKLELQAKYGAITPEGQERLTVLQAKMSGLLQTRLEQASSNGRNFANIPISCPDAPSQEAVQTKLTIGEPGDKYEQEADKFAEQLDKLTHAPASPQAAQNLQHEEMSVEEKEIQRKPMLQLRAGEGGMTATTGLETAINQARGGGQPLADQVRKPMEQFLGADFSSVKVHTDQKADQLSRAIQARAFTTGQDIFFAKGEYNPGSREGKKLIFHEGTHVAQQNGEKVQRMPLPQPKLPHRVRLLQQHGQITMQKSPQGMIQRNVGFEFEVGRYQVTKMTRNILPAEAAGTNVIPNADQNDSQLAKADLIARKTGFELQIDEGARDKHLEFVTNPPGFTEDKAGRAALKQAMEDMEALGHEVEQKVAASQTLMNNGMGNQQVIQIGEISGGVPTRPETLIRGVGQMEAEPQTTAGIRLDQIPSLIANMARQPGETQEVSQARDVQRTVMAAKSNAADQAATRAAVGDVRTAIGTFRTQMQTANVVLPANFGSEKLVGLMSLIYVYLRKGQIQVNDYPKSLFPMLGITDFGTMFNMLPADDQTPFAANAQRFEDINLDAAGLLGTGATAFFAGGFAPQLTNMTLVQSQQTAAALGAITRHDWLTDVPNGVDRLSRGYANIGALESMGKLNRGERVGKTNKLSADTTSDAPILELRRHVGHLGINNWKDWALDMYDFLVKLNDLKTNRFEQRRYDFNQPK